MSANPRILIAGAGRVGCYLGGCLALEGRDVSLLLRPRLADELREHGLTICDAAGSSRHLDADALKLIADDAPAAALSEADIIVVTARCAATSEMAQRIAAHARSGVLVLSLQNGVGNLDILRAVLPQQRVVAGMVGFGVEHQGAGRFQRVGEGSLVVPTTGELGPLLEVQGVDCEAHPDLTPLLWGKLLLSLNDALNALSGLPLREQLQDRAWRRLQATMMDEALAAMRAANIKPAQLTPIAPLLLPRALRLPDFLYVRMAPGAQQIDPQARSSMWQDLQQGRPTEIDCLQGAVIALAKKHRLDALLCARVLKAIKDAEAAKSGSPNLQPAQLV